MTALTSLGFSNTRTTRDSADHLTTLACQFGAVEHHLDARDYQNEMRPFIRRMFEAVFEARFKCRIGGFANRQNALLFSGGSRAGSPMQAIDFAYSCDFGRRANFSSDYGRFPICGLLGQSTYLNLSAIPYRSDRPV